MKSFAFAVLALLAVQSVAAFSKPVYEPKKPVYEPKKAVYVAKKPVATPSPVPPPAPKPVTITCAPKPVIASVPAALNCTDGYKFTVDAKQGPICSKELCIQPYVEKKAAPAKPVYKKPVYAFKKGNYFYGKKVAEKKPVYEPKKPVYSKGHYFLGKKIEYATPAPTPATLPYCVYPEPSPSPKPVKPVYEPKKPKYEPKKVDIKGLFSKLG